jgi:hypothetical protein
MRRGRRSASEPPLLAAVLFLTILGFELDLGAEEPPLAATPTLLARWLEARGDRIEAEGEVRLQLGRCARLEAGALRLLLQRGIGQVGSLEAEGALLEVGSLRLAAQRLRIDADGRLEASYLLGTPCGCPGEEQLLRIGARRAWIAPGGVRLHLLAPSLRIGSRAILALPYLALPLRRGVSGLLLPELGWSGRDGVRLLQGGHLALGQGDGARADLTLAAGWIEGRGAIGRARARYFLDGRAHAELALLGLHDGDRARGLLAGELAVWGRSVAVGLVPDLASDAMLLSELERDPARVFAPYLRSRAWASFDRGPLLLLGTADLLQQQQSPLSGQPRDPSGVVAATLALLPVRLLGPLHLELLATGRIYSDASLRALEDPALGGAGLAELDAVARLAVAERVGPLAISGQLGYRLASRWREVPTAPREIHLHAGLGGIEAALPIGRGLTRGPLLGLPAARYQHRIEPFVGMLWTAAHGVDPWRPTGEGSFVSLGFRTGLVARAEGGGLRRLAHNEMRFDLPLARSFPGSGHSGVLASGSFGIGPRVASHLAGQWRWSPSRKELLELRAEACLRLPRWLQSCVGYHRLREAAVEDGFQLAAGSWVTDPTPDLLRLGTSADQAVAGVRAVLGRLSAFARVAVDPVARQLSLGSYGVEFRFGCGCYRVELAGQSRAGEGWPDLLARFTLAAPGGSCLE